MAALTSLVIDGAWIVDLAWRAATGRHLVGGSEYMWDARHPAWLRLLSLFHVWLPPTLVWALRRTGYDRRAFAAQTALAFVVIAASRLVGPEANSNFAFRDPFFGRAWGPWPVHVLAVGTGLAVVHALTHVVLRRTVGARPAIRPDRVAEHPIAPPGP
jgi:hypothetical protein